MYNRSKIIVVVLMVLACFVFLNCDPNRKKVSNEDLYYQALGFWAETDQNFHLLYDPLPIEKKKEMIDGLQLLLDSKKILNVWKLTFATNDEEGQYAQATEWKKMKNKLIIEIVNKYLTEEG